MYLSYLKVFFQFGLNGKMSIQNAGLVFTIKMGNFPFLIYEFFFIFLLFFHLECFFAFALNRKSDTVSHGLVEVRWNHDLAD